MTKEAKEAKLSSRIQQRSNRLKFLFTKNGRHPSTFHSSVDRQRLPAQDSDPDVREEPKSECPSEPNPDATRRPFPVREGLRIDGERVKNRAKPQTHIQRLGL